MSYFSRAVSAAASVRPSLRTGSPLAEHDQRLHNPGYRERLQGESRPRVRPEIVEPAVVDPFEGGGEASPHRIEGVPRPGALGVAAERGPVVPSTRLHTESSQSFSRGLALTHSIERTSIERTSIERGSVAPAPVERASVERAASESSGMATELEPRASRAPRGSVFEPKVARRSSVEVEPRARVVTAVNSPSPSAVEPNTAPILRERGADASPVDPRSSAAQALAFVDRWIRSGALEQASAPAPSSERPASPLERRSVVEEMRAEAARAEVARAEASASQFSTERKEAPAAPVLNIGKLVVEVTRPAEVRRAPEPRAPSRSARGAVSQAAEAWASSSAGDTPFGWRQR